MHVRPLTLHSTGEKVNQEWTQPTEPAQRGLEEAFLGALESGCLTPVLARVKIDDTLLLAIRAGCVNVYYRGCNLMKIESLPRGLGQRFSVSFDVNHLPKAVGDDDNLAATCHRLKEEILLLLQQPIDSSASAHLWVDAIPKLKLAVDLGLGCGSDKHEREFQQLVARENNRSGISNETEYFIADIEYASPLLGARFDMMGIRWLASDRKKATQCRLALIEMKYGDSALSGSSGILAHLEQAEQLIAGSHYKVLNREITTLFAQLRRLGLVRFGPGGNKNDLLIDQEVKPELIFLLANHNPRSTKLNRLLDEMSENKAFRSLLAMDIPVRFFAAGFGGYALHVANVLTLEEFRTHPLLRQQPG